MSCEQVPEMEDLAVSDEAPTRRCLTGAEILAAEDRGFQDNWVPTPEWMGPGAGVYVLTPSGEDRERYERQQKTRRVQKGRRKVERREMNLDELRERLMVDFTCDENGQRLFNVASKEDTRETIRLLRKKAAAPVGRIGDRVIELMGWSDADLEDMVGNSESGQS